MAVARSGGVHHHFASAIALRIVLLHDLSPKHASSTEFCQFHEIDSGDAHIEFDTACHFVGAEAGVGELSHPFITPRERIAKFLINVGTGVAEHFAIHRKHAQPFHRSHHFKQFGSHFGDSFKFFALFESSFIRIEIDRAYKFVGSAFLFKICHEHFSKFHHLVGANSEIHLRNVGVDAIEEHIQIKVVVQFEAKRSDAFVEHIQSLGIGFFHIGSINFLTSLPVVVGACATHIRIFTGK